MDNLITILKQDMVMSLISAFTLLFSSVAAIYAYRTYKLKSGVCVRGTFIITSSRATEDKYISNVTLENLKDRSIGIFQIWLELDYGYFLKIDDFENNPLILKPFEVFSKKYEPIDMYVVNKERINLNNLLADDKIKKKLVLSTTFGRYDVPKIINIWSPIRELLLKNFTTAVIIPMCSWYKGKAFGSSTKYIVHIKKEEQDDEIIPIYEDDYRGKKFRNFSLTYESLKSKEALENFIVEQVVSHGPNCTDLKVYDFEEWRKEIYTDIKTSETIEPSQRGWFIYNILGRAITKWDQIKSNYKKIKNNKK